MIIVVSCFLQNSILSFILQVFGAKNVTSIIDQRVYSPIFSTCDFYLFTKVKLRLQGKCFGSNEAIKVYSQKKQKATLHFTYLKSMEECALLWRSFIKLNGIYFEGAKINFDENIFLSDSFNNDVYLSHAWTFTI